VTAVEDRQVAAAVAYIRSNAREPIGVDDVVKQSKISRRALEIRFRRILGCSIRDEIQRLRIGWARQLLVETGLSVAKIADAAGFSSLSYLSKVFRRATGETLGEYRRNHRVP
jgi:LacI family transcriptional regulator